MAKKNKNVAGAFFFLFTMIVSLIITVASIFFTNFTSFYKITNFGISQYFTDIALFHEQGYIKLKSDAMLYKNIVKVSELENERNFDTLERNAVVKMVGRKDYENISWLALKTRINGNIKYGYILLPTKYSNFASTKNYIEIVPEDYQRKIKDNSYNLFLSEVKDKNLAFTENDPIKKQEFIESDAYKNVDFIGENYFCKQENYNLITDLYNQYTSSNNVEEMILSSKIE